MNNKNSTSTQQGYELVNFCEFDKFAETSYCAVHGVDKSLNLGDITKVDETQLKPFNMICGGSPCQDFSVAGKQAGSKWICKDCGHEYNPLTAHWSERHKCPKCGSENLDKTRSSLLVEWLRVIRANKPIWGIYENVKNIVGKSFKETFDMFINELHEYGYNTYYQVLNAKDFGVPQNRERVYLIIILKSYDNGKFVFPTPFDSGVRLKDLLEDEVDEKFYINTPKAKELVDELVASGKLDKDISNTVRAGGRGSLERHQWDVVYDDYNSRVRQDQSTIGTLTTNIGNNSTRNGYKMIEAVAPAQNVLGRLLPDSGKIHQNQEVYSTEESIGTIKATHYKDPPKICE